MILKKTINENGETIYVTITEDEVNENDDIIFTTEEEKEAFKDKMKRFGESIKTELNKIKEEGIDSKFEGTKVREWADIIVNNTSRVLNKTVDGVTNTINSSINAYKEKKNKSETTKKLIELLPYMDAEDIHELAIKLVNDGQDLKNIDLDDIFPYFTEDDCSLIFIKAVSDGNVNFDISEILPFVNEDCLSTLVDLYVNEKINLAIDVEDLYPYLNKEDIKKIFNYIMSKSN